MEKQKVIFNWIKETELLPALNAKKTKLNGEISFLNRQLKNVEETIELLDVADEFCEMIRDELFKQLQLLRPEMSNSNDSDDSDNNDDGERKLLLLKVTFADKKRYTFEGKFSKLYESYMDLGNHEELFGYIQKQFVFMSNEAKALLSGDYLPKLYISRSSKEIVMFREYELEGVKVEFHYMV